MTYTLTPNAEQVLRRAVARIKDNLMTWDQSSFVSFAYDNSNEICGTTACLAGQIVMNEMGLDLTSLLNFGTTQYRGTTIARRAAELLDIGDFDDDEHQEIVEALFYDTGGCGPNGDFEGFVAELTEITGIDFNLEAADA